MPMRPVRTDPPIISFQGRYRFLSNFYLRKVHYDGIMFKSSEHAYQAAKCCDVVNRLKIANLHSPREAKKAGKKVVIPDCWDEIKVGIMRNIVMAKFGSNPDLMDLLLETGTRELIEGNSRRDTFWGVCNGIGENNLGKILMQIRSLYA